MNFPPEMNPDFGDGNAQAFYVPVMAQSFPGQWIQNPFYNAVCFPVTAFRSGSPCFPYPSAFIGYPAFQVSPSPLPPMFSQWSSVPMASYTGHIQPYTFRKKPTKSSQSGPEQDESLSTEEDIYAQAVNDDMSSVTSTTSAHCKENDDAGRRWYSTAPKRRLHGTRPKTTLDRCTPFRNSTASEKRRVRGRGGGSSTAEFRKTFKGSICLNDLAGGGGKPEDVAHHKGNSQYYCDSSNVHYNRAEGKNRYTKQRGWQRPELAAVGMYGEIVNVSREMSMSKEKNGYRSLSQALPSGKTRGVHVEKGQKNAESKEGKRRLTSSKAAGDSLRFSAQDAREKRKPGSPESHWPSLTWPREASRDIQLCVRMTDKQPVIGHGLSGPEVAEEAEDVEPYEQEAEDVEPYEQEAEDVEPYDEQEAEDVEPYDEQEAEDVEPYDEQEADTEHDWDEHEIRKAIMEFSFGGTYVSEGDDLCDWDYEADFEPNRHACYKGHWEENTEVHKVSEWPQEERCLIPSTESQLIYSSEAARWDGGTTEKEHLAAPGLAALRRAKSWPGTPSPVKSQASTNGSEKIVKSRKLDGETARGDDVEGAGDNSKSSPKIRNTLNGREREAKAACTLNRNVRANDFPEDFGNSDGVCEVECLSQEIGQKSRLILHKGSVYQEIGKVIKWKSKKFALPQTSVWHVGKKGKKSGAFGSIPEACRGSGSQGKEGCATSHGGLQEKLTPTKQKAMEYKTSSPRSTEW